MQQQKMFFGKTLDANLKWNVAVVAAFFFLFCQSPPGRAFAMSPGPVVINEVAWAGSTDSSSDEWIELYNTSDAPVDLFGWSITDSGVSSDLSGVIPAKGFFLIEDHELAVSTVSADSILKLSLKNSGDRLELLNEAGTVVDAVNSSGKAWFAGSAASKASMERIEALISGDLKENWQTSAGEGEKASKNSSIIGTPRRANSAIQKEGARQQQIAFESTIGGDNIVTVKAHIEHASDLFAYGFELFYDPSMLEYQSSKAENFLSGKEPSRTSFQAALENGLNGRLIVAEARTDEKSDGTGGGGDLFSLRFKILDPSRDKTDIRFGKGSFLSTSAGEVSASFGDQTIPLKSYQLDVPPELEAAADTDRYAIRLNWKEIPGAEFYRIFRKNMKGEWVLLDKVTSLQFIDGDKVKNGRAIIPFQPYFYRVIPVRDSKEGPAAEKDFQETRGIKGDTTRDDRVDGRDLEKLARSFGKASGDSGFDRLSDTNYDGQVNGSDLIDIGLNFGKTFSL